LDTRYTIEENGIKTVGVGNNLSEAAETLFIERGGETLAIINCCEHEYSIATETTAGANPLNPIQQYYKIQEARDVANYVLVIVHGGHEHYNLPSPRMQELYRFFIDSGADAVVNHHQHCYSGYEIYKEKPIFYGVGNFCFDRLNDGLPASWHEGYMVELSFGGNDGVKFRLIPYNQCKKEATVVLMNDKERDAFFQSIRQLNTVISDTSKLKRKHEEWMDSNGRGFEYQFFPYKNHWLISANIRRMFPSFLSKQRLLVLQNHFECESHRDRSLFALNKLLRKKNL
jgi:poly-gamma-glutamate synthesis protein (capsule biosynthesis protein)